jgi:hypothetical protein
LGQSLPESEFDLAEFGEAEDHFRVGGYNYRLLQMGGIIGILVGLGMVCSVALVPLFGPPGPGGHKWPLLIKCAFIGLAITAAGVGAWSRSRSHRGLQILVCQRGLVWMRPNSAEGIPWDSIFSVYRLTRSNHEASGSLQPNLQFVIQYGAGRKLILDETLQSLDHLREIVEERTLDNLLAPALEQIRDGGLAPFGKVWISSEGLQFGKQLLPWSRFGHAVAEQGQLAVYDRDHNKVFCKVNLAEVPNVHVLLALAEFFGRSAEAEPKSGGSLSI